MEVAGGWTLGQISLEQAGYGILCSTISEALTSCPLTTARHLFIPCNAPLVCTNIGTYEIVVITRLLVETALVLQINSAMDTDDVRQSLFLIYMDP